MTVMEIESAAMYKANNPETDGYVRDRNNISLHLTPKIDEMATISCSVQAQEMCV